MPKTLLDKSKPEPKKEEKKGDKPDFVNRNEGVAAWVNKSDKTGDEYLSVKLPLGLGTVNLFRNQDKEE